MVPGGLSNNPHPERNQRIPFIDTYFFKKYSNNLVPSTQRPS